MRIGAHILGFERQLINTLNKATAQAQQSQLRLATGLRLNSARDDPSAMIALSRYQGQLSTVNSSIKNVNRATDIVSQVQSNLGQIRGHIDTIREAALEDVGGQLSAGERAIRQNTIDNAINAIDSLADGRINGRQLLNKLKSEVVGTTTQTSFSSLNPAQAENLQVNSSDVTTNVVLSGTVAQAQTAELTYDGAAGATVQSSATFSVTGNLGNANIAMTAGESLVDVRDRVNQESGTTGVVASLSGDDLVFSSAEAGAGAHVEVQAVSVSQTVDVSGVNALQVVDFQVDSMNPTSGVTLSGQVKDRAERGQLSYDSNNGVVKQDATFTLSGNLGNAAFSVSGWESISGVRDRINLETANTGVVASISGDDIVLKSADYGSGEYAYVEVTSGTFDVSGGQSSGAGKVDYGRDARADINGTDYYGDGNRFSNLTIGPGTFTFEFAPEYESSYDDITISSEAGVFNISGGNGDGTADGTDKQATINGQNLAPVSGNQYTFSEGSGNFTIEFVDGFNGALDPITVSTSADDIVSVTGDDTSLSFSLFGDRRASTLQVTGVSSAGLGGITGSLADLITGGSKSGLGNWAADAVAIADEALGELSLIEARVDAFSNSILSSAAAHNESMQVSLEESIARISNVNEAEESALLSRSVLMADNAQAALALFHGQQRSMSSMLMRMAGFA